MPYCLLVYSKLGQVLLAYYILDHGLFKVVIKMKIEILIKIFVIHAEVWKT